MLVFALAVADILFWYRIVFVPPTYAGPVPSANFLDVGQGDSELVIFQDGTKVMTDAGPDGSVLASLENVLGANDRYIDLAVITHPQSDHYGGFASILDHYRIGAFIYNGRSDDPGVKTWPALLAKIKEDHIPLITLGKGDKILIGTNKIDILSPDANFAESGELNDTGLVERIETPQFTALLTADTGFDVQDALVAAGVDLRADILKVAHHGSKFSTDDGFLKAVDPKVAVVEVGAKNTFGHPAPETLARIAASTGAAVFRTDRNGTVRIWRDGNVLKVATGKQ
ncbi:MAG: hypothetical protein P4L67_01095 [Candidatus Pacebacteria bacterium]|nr:hypothetical protein [Candidatus Paceibacterota bacterium]